MLLKWARYTSVLNEASATREIELQKSIRVTKGRVEWTSIGNQVPPTGWSIHHFSMNVAISEVCSGENYITCKWENNRSVEEIKFARSEIEADIRIVTLFIEQVPATFSRECNTRVHRINAKDISCTNQWTRVSIRIINWKDRKSYTSRTKDKRQFKNKKLNVLCMIMNQWTHESMNTCQHQENYNLNGQEKLY